MSGRGRARPRGDKDSPSHSPSSRQGGGDGVAVEMDHTPQDDSRSKHKPRSNRSERARNRRPDVQVYVPRGRRLTSHGDTPPNRPGADVSTTSLLGSNGVGRRSRPSAEMYVPRHRRDEEKHTDFCQENVQMKTGEEQENKDKDRFEGSEEGTLISSSHNPNLVKKKFKPTAEKSVSRGNIGPRVERNDLFHCEEIMNQSGKDTQIMTSHQKDLQGSEVESQESQLPNSQLNSDSVPSQDHLLSEDSKVDIPSNSSSSITETSNNVNISALDTDVLLPTKSDILPLKSERTESQNLVQENPPRVLTTTNTGEKCNIDSVLSFPGHVSHMNTEFSKDITKDMLCSKSESNKIAGNIITVSGEDGHKSVSVPFVQSDLDTRTMSTNTCISEQSEGGHLYDAYNNQTLITTGGHSISSGNLDEEMYANKITPDDVKSSSSADKSSVVIDNQILDLPEHETPKNLDAKNCDEKSIEVVDGICTDIPKDEAGKDLEKSALKLGSSAKCNIEESAGDNVLECVSSDTQRNYIQQKEKEREDSGNIDTTKFGTDRDVETEEQIMDTDSYLVNKPERRVKKSDAPVKPEKQAETVTSVEEETDDTNMEADDNEDSWDAMFDDDGECLDPSAMEELTKTVGKVKIQKAKINYLEYQPKVKTIMDFQAYEHIIEIYDFPAEFVTRDLITAYQSFMSKGFDLKWVDDTHALGIFSSAIAARDALTMTHPLLKARPLSEASTQSKTKAKRCTEFLLPYKARPETTASAARRLVTGALGLASNIPREQRDKERKQLKDAKAKRKQERKNREDIWEGTFGKCAMDEEGT